ncbi:hypothetical protein Micbo1qcDRAFT_29471 [Microdochium bolleyi]|uniref:Uncharacterized protein n=1 Tax=Microdochium bolleyi TaxID=196109 RepID=A0A136JFF5_9PEZI|nr:hypothetical protein Micbo1qcDRAFT_29471 [Microdochium bolleyi]
MRPGQSQLTDSVGTHTRGGAGKTAGREPSSIFPQQSFPSRLPPKMHARTNTRPPPSTSVLPETPTHTHTKMPSSGQDMHKGRGWWVCCGRRPAGHVGISHSHVIQPPFSFLYLLCCAVLPSHTFASPHLRFCLCGGKGVSACLPACLPARWP